MNSLLKNSTVVLFLVTVCFFPSHVKAEPRYLTRYEAVEKMIHLFFQSGNPEFSLEEYYCLHENRYAHFVPDGKLMAAGFPLMCVFHSNLNGYPFTDVPDDIYIMMAYELEWIQGSENGRFYPDEPITYNEAVALLTRAFGLGIFADMMSDTPFPDGYMLMADIFDLLYPQPDGNEKMTGEMFDQLLENFATGLPYMDSGLFEDFKPAQTPWECMDSFSTALFGNNIYMQMAYMDEKSRDTFIKDYPLFFYASGGTNLWLESFTFEEITPLTYNVVLEWATSGGPAGSNYLTVHLTETSTDGISFYWISQIQPDLFISILQNFLDW